MRFPEEERFALIRVTGELEDTSSALEDSQVTNDIIQLLLFKRRKCGHAGAGDSIPDDAGEIAICEVLHPWSRCDVRCVLPAAAIRTVTTGAVRRKDGGAWRWTFLYRLLRMQSDDQEQAKSYDLDRKRRRRGHPKTRISAQPA
jgi:hypothetical protein